MQIKSKQKHAKRGHKKLKYTQSNDKNMAQNLNMNIHQTQGNGLLIIVARKISLFKITNTKCRSVLHHRAHVHVPHTQTFSHLSK